MAEKKCKKCGSTKSDNWIEKKNLISTAYFCSQKCLDDQKGKSEESGTCEFC